MSDLNEGRGKRGQARHQPMDDDWGDNDERRLPKLKIDRKRARDFKEKNREIKMDEDAIIEHTEFGSGQLLDLYGNSIEIMFEHGIEVLDLDDENLIENETLDEARGRPRKDGGNVDDEASGNIVTQLQKVSNGTAEHVRFANGQKHPITANHARAALDKHASFEKPKDKADFQGKIGHSHDSFRSAIGVK